MCGSGEITLEKLMHIKTYRKRGVPLSWSAGSGRWGLQQPAALDLSAPWKKIT